VEDERRVDAADREIVRRQAVDLDASAMSVANGLHAMTAWIHILLHDSGTTVRPLAVYKKSPLKNA
jgi:hypothetical protein